MKPRRTHDSNKVFELAGGNEDNSLWVTLVDDVVASVWEPTPEERLAIAEGANIQLNIWGGQPPVALTLTRVPLGKPAHA